MAKEKAVYFCQECGFESAKWMGQCPGCKTWNSFVEEPVVVKRAGGKKGAFFRKKMSCKTFWD